MAVQYEWVVETVEDALTPDDDCDVIDHYHCATFKEARTQAATIPEDGCHHVIVLVRDDAAGRLWAYLDKDGKLPAYFTDSQGKDDAAIPIKFRKEVLTA